MYLWALVSAKYSRSKAFKPVDTFKVDRRKIWEINGDVIYKANLENVKNVFHSPHVGCEAFDFEGTGIFYL